MEAAACRSARANRARSEAGAAARVRRPTCQGAPAPRAILEVRISLRRRRSSSTSRSYSKREAEAEAGNKTKIKMGTRAVDAIEEKWGSIVAQAVQQVLSSCGDHVLEASIFGIPEKMTLRDACSNSRSALWCAILVASVHFCLDAGCVLVAKYVRRSLRQRLARIKPLNAVHKDRPDSLIATLHINWGSLLMASTGRPRNVVKRNSLNLRQLEIRIERIEEAKRAELTGKARAASEKKAKLGQAPDELIEPKKTPRQKRIEMHERKLGVVPRAALTSR